MGRIARVVAAGVPHHITQRGNRRQRTFFSEGDYAAYVELLSEWCERCDVEIWAYCLMPNHVHLVAVPESEDGLRRAVGEAHRRYTRRINFRKGWRGHLWQGRFASFPMDDAHLLCVARYIELNPVRAKLVRKPERWRWSSTRAHLSGKDDELVRAKPLLAYVEDWAGFLKDRLEEDEIAALRRHERTGRPLGGESFLSRLERLLSRPLKPKKPGRPAGSKNRKKRERGEK